MSDHKVKKVGGPECICTETVHGKDECPVHGKHPALNDDGELQFDFGIKDGIVIVDFGKSVKWIGLPPDDADEFAKIMMRVAHQARTGMKVSSVPS